MGVSIGLQIDPYHRVHASVQTFMLHDARKVNCRWLTALAVSHTQVQVMFMATWPCDQIDMHAHNLKEI